MQDYLEGELCGLTPYSAVAGETVVFTVLARYLFSHALSLLGNTVAAVALPWLVLARTGDAEVAGVIAVASG